MKRHTFIPQGFMSRRYFHVHQSLRDYRKAPRHALLRLQVIVESIKH